MACSQARSQVYIHDANTLQQCHESVTKEGRFQFPIRSTIKQSHSHPRTTRVTSQLAAMVCGHKMLY